MHYCISISFRFTHSLERSTGPVPHLCTVFPFFGPSLVTAASDVCCCVSHSGEHSRIYTLSRGFYLLHKTLNRCFLSFSVCLHLYYYHSLAKKSLDDSLPLCFARSFRGCKRSSARRTVCAMTIAVPFSDLCDFFWCILL